MNGMSGYLICLLSNRPIVGKTLPFNHNLIPFFFTNYPMKLIFTSVLMLFFDNYSLTGDKWNEFFKILWLKIKSSSDSTLWFSMKNDI
jgi:hypothetical protein